MVTNKKSIFVKRSLVSLAVSTALCSTSALVQAEGFALEEIVVTAQKRAQSLQDVPVSVAAVGGEKIADAGIQNLQDLSAFMPNVTINESNIDNNVFIRGIGSGINLGFEKSVGMYIDGVYAGRGQLARAPFLDMERVEVLKGPQGILFGKNTIAGAISIITAKPTEEFEGYVETYVDPENGDTDITGVVSGALSDSVQGRLAVNYRKLDGFYENMVTGDDTRERENKVVRGTLSWDVSDKLDMLLKYEKSQFDDVGSSVAVWYATPTSPFAPYVSNEKTSGGFQSGRDEFNNTDVDVASITLNYQLGDSTLTSITSYSAYDAAISDDINQAPFFVPGMPDAILQLNTDEEFTQLSQEVRLVSEMGGKFDYIVGAYFQDTELKIDQESVLPVGGTVSGPAGNKDHYRTNQEDGKTMAAFVQGTFHLSDTVRTSLGWRITKEEKDFQHEQVYLGGLPASLAGSIPEFTLNKSETQPTWSANIQYDLNSETMLYATYSTGFKAGGFDRAQLRGLSAGETPDEMFPFDSEEVKSIEFGAKATLADGAAELNVALFRSEYSDLQVSAFDGNVGFVVDNAANSVTQGVEVDGRWRLTESLTLTGALSYLDATFDEYEQGNCSAWHANNTTACNGKVRDLSGEPLVFSPEWSGNLGLAYERVLFDNLLLRTNLDAIYTDSFFTAQDLDPITEQDSYTKVNLRIGVGEQDGTWEVALLVKNLTDEITSGWINDFAFGDSRGGGGTAYFGMLEPGRTIGIQGRYSF